MNRFSYNELPDILNGQYNALSQEKREQIAMLVACFHYRDLYKYPDGSIGKIEISPEQLRNLLAFWGSDQEAKP